MDPLQLAAFSEARRIDLRYNALPDAPTVAYVALPQRAERTRGFVAGALHRLADTVAPRPATYPTN